MDVHCHDCPNPQHCAEADACCIDDLREPDLSAYANKKAMNVWIGDALNNWVIGSIPAGGVFPTDFEPISGLKGMALPRIWGVDFAADMNAIPYASQDLIETRDVTHGGERQLEAAQALKRFLRGCEGWDKLSAPQREVMEMLAVKITRILEGNANEPDHWRDISGYALLITNLLTKGTHL